MPKYVIFALHNFKEVVIEVESWEEWEEIYEEYNNSTSSLEMMDWLSMDKLEKDYPEILEEAPF